MVKPTASRLNHDVLSVICSFLEQGDLSAFIQTCKEWRSVALKPLYSRIYITERLPQSSLTTKNGTEGNMRWSIVSNSLNNSTCALKKLDLTLGQSQFLCSLIEDICVDDTVFVLFKLQGWIRRYFSGGNCNLKSVFYGNIPGSHFLVGYEGLSAVYLSVSILRLLTTLQIRNVSDFIGICRFAESNKIDLRLRKVHFYLTDTFSHESTPFDEGVALAFSKITHLEIKSSSNWCLLFIKQLHNAYGPSIFPRLKSFTLAHYHGNLINPSDERREEKLALDHVTQIFDVSALEEFNCKVGCSHLPLVHEPNSDGHFEAIHEVDQSACSCLPNFFEELSGILAESSISKLIIERIGTLFVSNPYITYHFKRHLATFLFKLKGKNGIKSLILDLKSELLPQWRNNLEDRYLAKSINYANDLLLQGVNGLGANKILVVDYFEGFVVWKAALFPRNTGLLEFTADHFSECKQIYEGIKDFVSVNSKIQFYLDPTYKKDFSEFFYDLFRVLLVVKKNPLFAQVMHQESAKNHNRSQERNLGMSQAEDFIALPDEISQPVGEKLLSGSFSFHNVFRHDTYFDLVNSRGVQSGKRRTIPCSCQGDEVKRFVNLLEHSSQL